MNQGDQDIQNNNAVIGGDYTVILFYNYVRIDEPQVLMEEQRQLCQSLGLKGRILIAHEGINATLEGRSENIEKYCRSFLEDTKYHETTGKPSRFADTHIKRSRGTLDGSAFRRLVVKVRKEVVALGLPNEEDINPREVTGTHLKPEELHQWFALQKENKKDFVIIDMRNDYEHRSGHFKDSVLPPMQNFRDLPKVLPTLEHLKDKTVVTVCTGGIRCEKASGYLIEKGFKDVYQLDGGIVTYMEQFENVEKAPTGEPAGNYHGSLYVFDERTTVAFTPQDKRKVIGTCERCSTASEMYMNCSNDDCYTKFIVCSACKKAGGENNIRLYCARCTTNLHQSTIPQ